MATRKGVNTSNALPLRPLLSTSKGLTLRPFLSARTEGGGEQESRERERAEGPGREYPCQSCVWALRPVALCRVGGLGLCGFRLRGWGLGFAFCILRVGSAQEEQTWNAPNQESTQVWQEVLMLMHPGELFTSCDCHLRGRST